MCASLQVESGSWNYSITLTYLPLPSPPQMALTYPNFTACDNTHTHSPWVSFLSSNAVELEWDRKFYDSNFAISRILPLEKSENTQASLQMSKCIANRSIFRHGVAVRSTKNPGAFTSFTFLPCLPAQLELFPVVSISRTFYPFPSYSGHPNVHLYFERLTPRI